MLTHQLTADGSFTFLSEEFGELFHSHSGARQEAEKKFVEPCQLAEKAAASPSLCLLDICYGLGYNSAAALSAIWDANPQCQVELIALELEAAIPRQAIADRLLEEWSPPIPQLLSQLAEAQQVTAPHLRAQLWLGDARQTLPPVRDSGWQADAVFLDPFSPPKCPQLWTVEFLTIAAQCLKPTGRLATYSCAAAVRSALQQAGLQVGTTPSVGRRSPGTLASPSSRDLLPLSEPERQHLYTRAAIPYRDSCLQDCVPAIEQRRQAEQQASPLEPTSHWKRRWSKTLTKR